MYRPHPIYEDSKEVFIWRDHYTAAVLHCLMNTSNNSIPCASKSATSLTIVALMLLFFALFSNAWFMYLCTAIVVRLVGRPRRSEVCFSHYLTLNWISVSKLRLWLT